MELQVSAYINLCNFVAKAHFHSLLVLDDLAHEATRFG